MKTLVEEKFTQYFETWISQLEQYLPFLLQLSKDHSFDQTQHQALISQLTAHHKDYYTAKWAAAHEDVLAFFSPTWLTQVEISYLWVTGWKPSTAFRLIDSLRMGGPTGSSFIELTEEQSRKIEELRTKVRVEEEKVEMDMERQQVALADRRMVELARLVIRAEEGEVGRVGGLVEVAVKGLLGGLERVMKMGDCVRLKTLKGVLEVLSPRQCVEFLAANSMVMIRLRKFGKKRDYCHLDEEKCAVQLV